MSPHVFTEDRLAVEVLACPVCRGRLVGDENGLVCADGHHYAEADGIFDMWPAGAPVPRLDVFSGPYGLIYDSGIKERWLGRLAGWLGWGTDVNRMYRLMDEGVKCAPGQVVVDVPVGGAPALRSAPGRLLGVYVGIDLSSAMLSRARTERDAESLAGVLLARGDAHRLPLPDESVDRVLCFNGLHVLPDKGAVMGEFERVLKPGGELWGNVLIVPAALGAKLARPWTSRGGAFFHPADPTELEMLAMEHGFEWEQDAQGSMLFFRGRKIP